jgi:hypothetical protein
MVSSRLDGGDSTGLDEHLAGCERCRRFLARSEAVRRSLRFEPVGSVPDLAARVREAVDVPEATPVVARRRRPTRRAAVAALVAGVVVGAALVGVGDEAPTPVAAAPLPTLVSDAQGAVAGLHAELTLVERGWHPEAAERRFAGTLDYRAPESLLLEWRDRTDYPSAEWRPNDVRLVTDGRTWAATGLPDCPSDTQPSCAQPPREEAVTGRPPFSADAVVPLELIVPVQSFARIDTARVVGTGRVAGRPTIEVAAAAAQVGPLIDGLRPAGNLRKIHPSDTVSLSLDAELMVPLRLEVRASADADRRTWALNRGYDDRPGLVILRLAVTDLSLDVPDEDTFVPPAASAIDAGFRDGSPAAFVEPPTPEGFTLHRTGRLSGGTPTSVWSWSDGRAWIRLSATDAWTGPRLFGELGALVLPRATAVGDVYVSPDGHRMGLHGRAVDLVVEGSVPTDDLVAFVEDLGLAAAPLPPSWPERRVARPVDIRRALPGALGLDVPGFAPPAARLEGGTAELFTAGSGDRRLLLVQVDGGVLSPPLGKDPVGLEVRGAAGRWSPDTGQLEWVEGGRLITLRGTGLSRAELLGVAEALEPL